MSRANQFIRKIDLYGEEVIVKYFPDTSSSNKCTCWEYGWPNPDCALCDGSGFKTEGIEETIKVFVQPREQSPKMAEELFGSLILGDARVFFSPMVEIETIEKLKWQNAWYKLSRHDMETLKNEIIYKVALLERLEEG